MIYGPGEDSEYDEEEEFYEELEDAYREYEAEYEDAIHREQDLWKYEDF
jgi:hypothetical protein